MVAAGQTICPVTIPRRVTSKNPFTLGIVLIVMRRDYLERLAVETCSMQRESRLKTGIIVTFVIKYEMST